MSEENQPMLEGHEDTTPRGLERRRVPGNVYYCMPPYYVHVLVGYSFFGSIGCWEWAKHLSSTSTSILWIVYVLLIVALMSLHPEICHELKKTDEDGKEVMVRYPLVGFKSCEAKLDLEGIERGDYDPPPGMLRDGRLHDGYRYSTALLRIPL